MIGGFAWLNDVASKKAVSTAVTLRIETFFLRQWLAVATSLAMRLVIVSVDVSVIATEDVRNIKIDAINEQRRESVPDYTLRRLEIQL